MVVYASVMDVSVDRVRRTCMVQVTSMQGKPFVSRRALHRTHECQSYVTSVGIHAWSESA